MTPLQRYFEKDDLPIIVKYLKKRVEYRGKQFGTRIILVLEDQANNISALLTRA